MQAVASPIVRPQTSSYRPLQAALRQRGWVERPRSRVRVSGTKVWAYPPSTVRHHPERHAVTYFQTRLHLEPDRITVSYAGIVANDDVVLHGTSTHPLCRRYLGDLDASVAEVLNQLDQIEEWRYDDGSDPNGRLFRLLNELHFSLEERGWQWHPRRWVDYECYDEEDDAGEVFVDWLPERAEWRIYRTLRGIDAYTASEGHVYPANVYADDQGLVLDPAGTPWACARHVPALPTLTFPPDERGLAGLLASLTPYEQHEIDGQAWSICAYGSHCSEVPGRPPRDCEEPPRRRNVMVPANTD